MPDQLNNTPQRLRHISRDIVGAFIFSQDDYILLGKVGVYESLWAVPGGGIEKGESHEDAVIREIMEETNIDIRHENMSLCEDVHTGESEKVLRETEERVIVDMSFHDFIVRIKNDHDKILFNADDDFRDARWFKLDTIAKLSLAPPTRLRLTKLGYITDGS